MACEVVEVLRQDLLGGHDPSGGSCMEDRSLVIFVGGVRQGDPEERVSKRHGHPCLFGDP